MKLTVDNCFKSKEFIAFWDAIHDAIDHAHCWDDDVMLEILIEYFDANMSVADAADKALEDYEIGMAEYYMSIPSWA